MSQKAKKELCAAIGGLGWFCAIGFVGGIEYGAPLFNFVYAFASMVVGVLAMDKGGFLK